MGLLLRLALAAAAGAIVFLICIFVGGLLATLNIPPAEFVGKFIREWATVIAVLAAVIYFARGSGATLP